MITFVDVHEQEEFYERRYEYLSKLLQSPSITEEQREAYRKEQIRIGAYLADLYE